MEPTQVVIIGGGATGAGILWDLSLRGISATLLEQGDIAHGAKDDRAFFNQWWRAAEAAGIRSRRLSADEARELEPNLATNILGAFTCPDAHVDVFRLVLANLEAAVARGGRFHTYSKVTSIHTTNGRVRGVRYRNTLRGEEHEIPTIG